MAVLTKCAWDVRGKPKEREGGGGTRRRCNTNHRDKGLYCVRACMLARVGVRTSMVYTRTPASST